MIGNPSSCAGGLIENLSNFGHQIPICCAHLSVRRNQRYGARRMKSAIVKHSVVIDGHKTSISLEDAFWCHLRDIARTHHWPVGKLIAEIDEDRMHNNLSSAIRVFVLEYFREKALRAGNPERAAE